MRLIPHPCNRGSGEAKAEQLLRAQPDGTMSIATADEITFTVHLVTRCPEARQFALHPSLVGLCHDLIGDDVRLYWDQAVYKKPEPVREFPWHQDNGYAFVEPQQYVTCWVPLTEATLDNGCPWVVPGAHRFGTLEHVSSPAGLRCQVDTDEAVPVQAQRKGPKWWTPQGCASVRIATTDSSAC